MPPSGRHEFSLHHRSDQPCASAGLAAQESPCCLPSPRLEEQLCIYHCSHCTSAILLSPPCKLCSTWKQSSATTLLKYLVLITKNMHPKPRAKLAEHRECANRSNEMQRFLCWLANYGICMRYYSNTDTHDFFPPYQQKYTVEKMRKELCTATQDRHTHNSCTLGNSCEK